MNNSHFQEHVVTDNVPFRTHRKLDLRHTEDFRKFNAKKFVFQIKTEKPIRVTAHSYTPSEQVEYITTTIEDLIHEALDAILESGVQASAIVQIFLHASGLDQDFVLNSLGRYKMTIGGVLSGNTIQHMVEHFAMMIQSGREVILDAKSTLSIMTYEPPLEYVK